MKKLLLLVAIAFAFTACNKCVECTYDNMEEWYVPDEDFMDTEEFGDKIEEICSDNFESKKEFNDYIEALEEEQDWECKSDFWN